MSKPTSVAVRCLLLIGDDAEIVADVPREERAAPQRYPASQLAADLGVDRAALPGMRLLADVDASDRLSNWRLP